MCLGGAAVAQTLQVAPFGGYRFGGDLYEEITATSLDIDGAPSVGATVDVFIDRSLSVTFIYSHQDARVDLPRPPGAPEQVTLSIDHWHVGGTQEFGRGAVRPFLVGTLGLTHYGGGGDSEVRFSMGAGGGVKLMPHRSRWSPSGRSRLRRVRRRRRRLGICAPNACVLGLRLSVAWQAEFTAGLVWLSDSLHLTTHRQDLGGRPDGRAGVAHLLERACPVALHHVHCADAVFSHGDPKAEAPRIEHAGEHAVIRGQARRR